MPGLNRRDENAIECKKKEEGILFLLVCKAHHYELNLQKHYWCYEKNEKTKKKFIKHQIFVQYGSI